MFFFVICSGVITFFAVVMCLFSGRQQKKEDEYLSNRQKQASAEELERAMKEQADWDLLNNWDDENG